MMRTQVCLTAKQHRALKREAAREGISMTEMLRRIVDLHLLGRRRTKPVKKEQILAFIALGDSGRKDTSANHDGALDEALRAGDSR